MRNVCFSVYAESAMQPASAYCMVTMTKFASSATAKVRAP